MLNLLPASLEEVAPLLDPAQAFDTTAGAASIRELCQGATCYRVETDQAEVVGAYALRMVRHEAGSVAWIQAGAGTLPAIDLTRSIVPAIEAQARAAGARQLAVTTRRNGLIRKLLRQGFEVSGITLRKNLS